jgi:hypothetical protein
VLGGLCGEYCLYPPVSIRFSCHTHVLEATGLCVRDGPYAGVRHWRHRRDFQRGVRRVAEALPFHEPERLVSVRQYAPHGAGANHGPATYLTYRENQSAFEAIGVWDPTEVSITGGGDPERVQALLVSGATLPLLRVQPVLGRVFSAEDDTPGNPLRAVLTHGYWQPGSVVPRTSSASHS